MDSNNEDRNIKIISFQKGLIIKEVPQKDINSEIVGQKAYGLLQIPIKWRLPFFVIDKLVYQQYVELKTNEQKNRYLADVKEMIVSIAGTLGIVDHNTEIIIRSSAEEEGMRERGQYESKFGELCKADQILRELYNSLEQGEDGVEDGIAFIVQRYFSNYKTGHFSNEIRFVKDKRDWRFEEIAERELIDEYNIGVRKWRTRYNIDDLRDSELLFSNKNSFKEKLREVAFFFVDQFRNRAHLELIWNDSHLYIAQVDFEKDNGEGYDPKECDIKVKTIPESKNFKVLREICGVDADKFHKVKNVFIYKSLELNTAPLYIIDDVELIRKIAGGVIPKELEDDLKGLLPNSIVIRSDLNCENKEERQFLPRSNELRNYDSIQDWLICNSKKLLEYKYDGAFILHVFIPARAAAFSCAKPNDRIVEIQSLWGLPEGLYYNAHDSFSVDTISRYTDYMDPEKLIITKDLDYKSTYIAPDENGRWVQKETKKTVSWKQSITEDQIKKIAIQSRKIAQKVGKSLSIMWFVGIDEDYYGADCLPWYHEEYDESSYSYGVYKKKHNSDEEKTIESIEDLNEVEKSDTIKIIRIYPMEESLLREKNFIERVGEIAQKKGLTIVLKGSALAHPLYQLLRKTDKVLLEKKRKPYSDYIKYNKLVRDNIPSIIQENLEDVRYGKVTGELLVRAYLEKLLEELYEVYDAPSAEELVKEFADVEELCLGLIKTLQKISKVNTVFFKSKEIRIAEKKKILESKNTQPHNKCYVKKGKLYDGFGFFEASWDRRALDIEIELRIFRDNIKEDILNKSQSNILIDKKIMNQMLLLGFKMQNEKSIKKLLKQVEQIHSLLMLLIENMKISEKKFNLIREKKKEKAGGFDKGYILLEAGIDKSGSKEILGVGELRIDAGAKSDIVPINKLDYISSSYIDYRKVLTQELLLRVKVPLCLQKWEYAFDGENIRKYFGDDYTLIVSFERVARGAINMSAYLSKLQEYEQLALE